MSLSVSKLSVIYRTEHTLIHALDEVDLELAPGTSTALIGESGSGKSTLALACLGLLPEGAIIGGEIRLNGEAVDYADPAAVARLRWFRVAMAFQNGTANLNPVHTVIEQVAEPLLCRTATKRAEALAIAAQALSRLGLFHDNSAVELSMGLSGDFTVAIEEGATMIRIGTAYFWRENKTT